MYITLQEIAQEIQHLSVDERKQLMHMFVDSFEPTPDTRKHSILELESLGAEIWKGIECQMLFTLPQQLLI